MTPQETQVVQTEAGGQAVAYNASGLTAGQTYQIALFPCGDSNEDATVMSNGERYPNRNGESNDGIFTFRDQDLDDIADNAGSTQNGTGEILTVFFADQGGVQQTTGVANSDGEIDFRVGVDDILDADCAVPVVWSDAAGGTATQLDLDDASTDSWNLPVEEFGVGGAAVFFQGEAPNGTEYSDNVLFLDLDQRFVVLEDGFQYFWGRAGDQYYYAGAEAEGFIPQSSFELYISIGDYLDYQAGNPPTSAYSRGDTPGTPINVVIEVGDFDGDADADDIRVTWDHPDPLEGNDDQRPS